MSEKVEVVRLFAALAEAKEQYDAGTHRGHYKFSGEFSRTAFVRFRTLSEDCWRLCYLEDQRMVLAFGDPSHPHECCTRYFSRLILDQLRECLRRAPSAGVPLVDSLLVESRYDPTILFDDCRAVLQELQEDVDHPFLYNGRPGESLQPRSGLVLKEADVFISVKSDMHDIPLVLCEIGYKSDSYFDIVSSVWLEHFAAPLVIGLKVSVS
jgi:hypothetical protein